MAYAQDGSPVEAGAKIQFTAEGHGSFVGYVNKLTSDEILLKGCKVIELHAPLQDEAPTYYDSRSFLTQDLSNIEVLQMAPF